MKIQKYRFDAAASSAFYDFTVGLYRDDPGWIAPTRHRFLSQFEPGHRFYRGAGNRHRHFIARVDGGVRGHVSALVNAGMRDGAGDPIGLVGFYECVQDDHLAVELLGAAADWLARQGVRRIWGPIQFDIWHGYRFMTRGFERPTFFGEPRNRPFYPSHFRGFGFRPLKTWASVELRGRPALSKLVERYAGRYRALRQEGYRWVPMTPHRPRHLRRLHAVLGASYGQFLGFTPLSFQAFESLFGSYLRFLDTRFVRLVQSPSGRVAGFSVGYPDVGEAVRRMRGRDDVLARIRFLLARRRAHRIVYHLIGVLPGERVARRGLGGALLYQNVHDIMDAGFERVLFALVAEDSLARKFDPDAFRSPEREYALYEMTL